MSVRIDKLQTLLGTIQRNAAAPRLAAPVVVQPAPVVVAAPAPVSVRPVVAVAPPAPVNELELDEPSFDEPKGVALPALDEPTLDVPALDEPGIEDAAPDSLDGDLNSGAPSVVAAAAFAKSNEEFEMEASRSETTKVEVDEVELDEVELDEHEPPQSGSGLVPRPLDRAIAEAEYSAPLTPPPESGPEPAKPPAIPSYGGPTMEQLGQTISLDEGPADSRLEVAGPSLAAPASAEVDLSVPPEVGTFDASLTAPPDARNDLERLGMSRAPVPAPLPASPAQSEVVARPLATENPAVFEGARPEAAPSTFLGWIDETLSL